MAILEVPILRPTTDEIASRGDVMVRRDVPPTSTCRVALDTANRVVGFVTWRSFDDGHGRVLDLMRRLPDAPAQACSVGRSRPKTDRRAR